jgi:hypothetical protein
MQKTANLDSCYASGIAQAGNNQQSGTATTNQHQRHVRWQQPTSISFSIGFCEQQRLRCGNNQQL